MNIKEYIASGILEAYLLDEVTPQERMEVERLLARYPELKATNSGAAERFIIGTFASVLFAAACAGLARWLTGLW